MKPNFTRFKKDVLKLIDYALTKEIRLEVYVSNRSLSSKTLNEAGNTCGSPACLAGYAPEVFPKRFKWQGLVFISPEHISTEMTAARGMLEGLNAPTCSTPLMRIFERNRAGTTDINVVNKRRELIQESRSFKHLEELIDTNVGWF